MAYICSVSSLRENCREITVFAELEDDFFYSGCRAAVTHARLYHNQCSGSEHWTSHCTHNGLVSVWGSECATEVLKQTFTFVQQLQLPISKPKCIQKMSKRDTIHVLCKPFGIIPHSVTYYCYLRLIIRYSIILLCFYHDPFSRNIVAQNQQIEKFLILAQ